MAHLDSWWSIRSRANRCACAGRKTLVLLRGVLLILKIFAALSLVENLYAMSELPTSLPHGATAVEGATVPEIFCTA